MVAPPLVLFHESKQSVVVGESVAAKRSFVDIRFGESEMEANP
jgi:hypothetical protein